MRHLRAFKFLRGIFTRRRSRRRPTPIRIPDLFVDVLMFLPRNSIERCESVCAEFRRVIMLLKDSLTTLDRRPCIVVSCQRDGRTKRIRLTGTRTQQVALMSYCFRNSVVQSIRSSVELNEDDLQAIMADVDVEERFTPLNGKLADVELCVSGRAAVAWSRYLQHLSADMFRFTTETATFLLRRLERMEGGRVTGRYSEPATPLIDSIIFGSSRVFARTVRFRHCKSDDRGFLSHLIERFLALPETAMLPSTIAVAADGACDHLARRPPYNATRTELVSTTPTCDGPVWAYQPFVNSATGRKLAIYAFMGLPDAVRKCYDYPSFDCPAAGEGCTNLMLSDDYCLYDGQKWWLVVL